MEILLGKYVVGQDWVRAAAIPQLCDLSIMWAKKIIKKK